MKYELGIEAAAKLLGVGPSRISQLVSDGTLDSTTIRGNRRISRESAEQYLANRKRSGRQPIASKATTMRFTLMNASYEVMELLYDPSSSQPLIAQSVLDPSRTPLSVVTSQGTCKRRELNEWWAHRSIPNTRPGLEKKLVQLGLSDGRDLPLKNLGLSLSDCYWLRPVGQEQVEWSQVNYFQNNFIGSAEGAWDDWLSNVGVDSPDNTSEGELPKKWVIRNGERMLVKGCRSDDQRPCNEVAATALHERLLSPADYVRYELASTKDGSACACANFLRAGEEYIPAAYVRHLLGATRGNSEYDRFCRFAGKLGMDEASVRQGIGKMIACDHILANNDRHWRNFGFIRNVDTLQMRLAPIFDTGNCLWYGKTAREVSESDWTFISRPFATKPEQQLAYAEHLEWFDSNRLEGFVEQAMEILAQSAHASEPERRRFIEEGLRKRVAETSAALGVLRYR